MRYNSTFIMLHNSYSTQQTKADPELGEPFTLLGEGADEGEPNPDIDPDDLSVMMHTSGTTGRPKLVMIDHHSQWANGMSCLAELGYRHEDRALHIAPLFHSADYLNVLLPAVFVGATSVIQSDFDPERTLELIDQESITATLGVPTHLERIQEHGLDGYDTDSLRFVVTSDAPIREDTVEWVTDDLCETLYNVYGLTETTGLVTVRDVNYLTDHYTFYCVVKTFLNVDVRLIELGEDVPPDATVEDGECDCLIARTPKLMHGYYGQPEKTAKTLRDGWLYTNDVVFREDDETYYLVHRIDHAIISGGENVYPLEVEQVLRRHPAVEDCDVTGEPDDDLGERVVAYVVSSDNALDTDEITEYWREDQAAAANYKRPREVYVVESLDDH
jgi:acyl-CoA synthetase (AMP-forming)/AMP-acid ligase II